MPVHFRLLHLLEFILHLTTGFSVALLAAWASQTSFFGHNKLGTSKMSPFGDPVWVKDKALANHYPCGQDAATALSRGCIFELATGTWQPPACTHREQNDFFSSQREWEFFIYENLTLGEAHPQTESGGVHDRRNLRAVASHDLPHLGTNVQVWTTWEFHLYRCAWLWKRDVLAANGNITGPIGGRQNCADEALMKENKFAMGDVVAGYRLRFLSCSVPPNFVV